MYHVINTASNLENYPELQTDVSIAIYGQNESLLLHSSVVFKTFK